jgi:hypothetical protein
MLVGEEQIGARRDVDTCRHDSACFGYRIIKFAVDAMTVVAADQRPRADVVDGAEAARNAGLLITAGSMPPRARSTDGEGRPNEDWIPPSSLLKASVPPGDDSAHPWLANRECGRPDDSSRNRE